MRATNGSRPRGIVGLGTAYTVQTPIFCQIFNSRVFFSEHKKKTRNANI